MANLYVKESWVNATAGHRAGDSDVYETFTDSVGELYRAMVKEYGRCIGRVYIDLPDRPHKPIGWVFVKRKPYSDSHKSPPETFLLETWVSVHTAPDTVTRKEHFAEVG